MKTLQTNNKSRSNRMITGIGKIVLFAFLFMFVFSMVCIVMDANISSNIENGTFDNIALAALVLLVQQLFGKKQLVQELVVLMLIWHVHFLLQGILQHLFLLELFKKEFTSQFRTKIEITPSI